MFCLYTENSQSTIAHSSINIPSKNIKKKHKKKRRNKKRQQKSLKLPFNMTTWTENFKLAATWQLKQQVAFWKARAKSLEYENSVLHDVIRRNQHAVNFSANQSQIKPDTILNSIETDNECEQEVEEDFEDVGDGALEFSETFLQFLTENAKYREDAKREKARLNAERDVVIEEEPRETFEQNRERLQELYGGKWQKISALETNMLSKFLNESDKYKPVYWPHIPLNLNYS